MNLHKGIARILFGILAELAAICLLIADPWIPIIDSVRVFVYLLVITGLVTGIAGLVSVSNKE